ncbi:Hypothetical protein SRAE_1000118400 [Strongyloides ratti]|uniref:BPTI/Kunitz inhibitor domain-containing protein n=1 Tax=Strongyloides ratti TaxID=34506 RepID=A0A090L472_STRRB|nr:Hypothetical protein SRAE_1000118400 [Strongyloides ratti]CEF62917.1 Hypothetical protein SRAE_1000118400 [Strongyloides ratti]
MCFFLHLSINFITILFLFFQIQLIIKCERLPEEIMLDLKIPKCPNGQNALIDSEGLTKCGSACPDGFNCYKNESEISEYCCPDIDLLHKLYDNIDRDFYLNTMKRYPEPKALTSKDVETAFPLFPNNDVWSNLASFPNTKILDIYDNLVNTNKNKKIMKISVLSNHKNKTEQNIIKNVTITSKENHPQKSVNDTLLKNILIPIKSNITTTTLNPIPNSTIQKNNQSKTLETLKTTPIPTTTLTTIIIPSTTSSNKISNNIRRKPSSTDVNTEMVNDINIPSHQSFFSEENLTNLQIYEKNKFLETENFDLQSFLSLSPYYCERHSLNYTCNNGTVLTQFVTRWYAKDNQCHTYTYSFCPGDTISMDKSLRSKEECEEICLKKGQKINSNMPLKIVQSIEKNDNNIIDEITNNTSQKLQKNFDLTDIDEIIKTMTIEDRTKLLTNQKTYASKIINEENSKNNLFNSQDTEIFQIHDNLEQFICVRPDTFAHICPDGFPSQLTLRWFVYENQCITFPYGYCHGDRVTEEAFAKTKKECEYHCLMNNHEKTDIL